MPLIAEIKSWTADLLGLIYPQICLACEERLSKQEQLVCLSCEHSLPETDFHKQTDNPVAKIFWGRVEIERTASFLFFGKKSGVQNMIHYLKYRGITEIGVWLGQKYGQRLKKEKGYQDIDIIIPVPLHSSKIRKRGYNQSDYLAEGLSKAMDIPYYTDCIRRIANSDSQTRKNRVERWENVSGIFEISDANQLRGKHLLLVDDVVTTGATLEACAAELCKVEGVKVSIVTIACAEHF